MTHYVDGFVVPVPIRNLDAYRRIAEQAGKIWMEHGALQYWECVGDDVKPGKITSFPQSVHLKDDETVVFSWILYNSREHRDSVNAKVMEDPRMKDMMDPKSMPFDGMLARRPVLSRRHPPSRSTCAKAILTRCASHVSQLSLLADKDKRRTLTPAI
jgi:uncharacterized protein YbaA (DUF1428 family)